MVLVKAGRQRLEIKLEVAQTPKEAILLLSPLPVWAP